MRALLVEFGDGGVVVGDEQPRGEVTGSCDVAIPVVHGPPSRVVSVLSDDHPAPLAVGLDRLVHGSVSELGEGGAFPWVVLADVVGQLNGGEPVGESPEQAPGVDLG